MSYRTRFAPSPTGPLHAGSLLAAVGSYLQARHHHGEWLLRIEDVDETRTVRGAADDIMRTLERFGLHWDSRVANQSTRKSRYQATLDELAGCELAYPCGCSRKDFEGSVYPGTCRNGIAPGKSPRAWRLRTARAGQIAFTDSVQGACSQDLEHAVGDFVIRRADGLFAYQLAVVVDDADQGITEVVRGTDLLDSTSRQIWLQKLLGFPETSYVHLPLITNRQGEKLSKQTGAQPIDGSNPPARLVATLELLGQAPPTELARATVADVWAWAIPNWQLERVPAGIAAGSGDP